MPTSKQESEIFYALGKRDAVAEILMMIRIENGNLNKVIQDIAEQLLAVDKEHTHAKWIVDTINLLK